MSAGGHDHFVGALTAGALKHGTLTDSMGTAESLTVFMDKPMKDKTVGTLGYTQGVIHVDKPIIILTADFLLRSCCAMVPPADGKPFLP